jgi:hypothetical protein
MALLAAPGIEATAIGWPSLAQVGLSGLLPIAALFAIGRWAATPMSAARWIWTIAGAAVAMALVIRLWRRRAPESHALGLTAAAAVMCVVLAGVVAPAAAAWMTGRDLAAFIAGRGELPAHVYLLDERPGSVIFYLPPALRARVTPDTFVDATRRSIRPTA